MTRMEKQMATSEAAARTALKELSPLVQPASRPKQTPLMQIDITSFIKNTGKLPSLPSIYFELSDAAENPKASSMVSIWEGNP